MARKNRTTEDFVHTEVQKSAYLDTLKFFGDYSAAAILLASRVVDGWCVELGNGHIVTMDLFCSSCELYFDAMINERKDGGLTRDDMARLLGVEGYATHCVKDRRQLDEVTAQIKELMRAQVEDCVEDEK